MERVKEKRALKSAIKVHPGCLFMSHSSLLSSSLVCTDVCESERTLTETESSICRDPALRDKQAHTSTDQMALNNSG